MLTERALESFKQFVETKHCLRYGRVWRYYAQGKNLNKRRLKRRQGSVEYFHYPGSIGDHNNYENSVVRYG